jgi:hypothetical protein
MKVWQASQDTVMSLSAICKAVTAISEADRLEIREELERILASAPFRNSRRYPSLLRYVVEKTLAGEEDELKERSLGVEVFHRAPDYDTNADPVVRFSAGEVRRRLAQYYQQNSSPGSIEITLPTGSYVPLFLRAETPEERKSPGTGSTTQAFDEIGVVEGDAQAAEDALLRLRQDQEGNWFSRRSFLSGLLLGSVAISALVPIVYFLIHASARQPAETPVIELWSALLTAPDAVVISVGRTHVDETERPEPPNATIEQHILRPDARISLASVQVVSQVAGFLETQQKQFRIHEAYSTALQDLHRRPVILVSGYNNIWTMRLLRPLRFHLEQAGSLHYIFDTQHPERRDWAVDFDTPYLQQTVDYAIIARFYDSTTEGPVVVIAGIGSNGSQAAGEFVVSNDSLETLAHAAPHGSLKQNFEAVLRVEVIGGNSGAATVVASQFW